MTGRDPTNEFNEQYWENVLGNTKMTPDAVGEPEKASGLTYCRVCDDDVLPGSWLLCAYDACPFVPKEHGISEGPG